MQRRFMTRILAGLAALAARPIQSMAQQAAAKDDADAAPLKVFRIGDLVEKQRQSKRPWLPFFRSPALYCGVYVLAAGGEDKQKPHAEDEVYYVESGRAKISVEGEERDVAAGSIVYVKAHAEHQFHSIEKELRLVVFFSTAKV